jgi:predicted glutamine amidotransferase
MCGHFGIAGVGINGKDLKALKGLGIVTQLRGLDGAGVYADKILGTKSKNLPITSKSEWDFCDLMAHDSSSVDNIMADVVIGHCRAATAGKVSVENCHPFEHGNFVIAHNGTLHTPMFTPHGDTTDSEEMVKHMAMFGIHQTLEELSYWDAFSIVGLDKSNGDIWFSRNDQRPLHIAISNDRAVIYWTSELEALKYILDRSDIGKYTTYSFTEGYSFKTNIRSIKPGKADIFKRTEIEYKDPWGSVNTNSKKPGSEQPNSTSKSMDDTHRNGNVPWVNNPDNCAACFSPLTTDDYELGSWSDRLLGWICEPCVKEGQKYAS